MSHHGKEFDATYKEKSKFVEEILKHHEELKRFAEYPEGKLNKTDEGVLAFGVGIENNKVVLQFAEPTSWIGMNPDQAIEMAKSLIKKAQSINGQVVTIEL